MLESSLYLLSFRMLVRIHALCGLLLFAGSHHTLALTPDFGICFNETQNKSLADDPATKKFFVNRTDFAFYENNRSYVNLNGCNHFCGDGRALYPAGAVAIRFAAFILPLLILSAAFSLNNDVRWDAVLFIFIHLVANPLDSLWSIFMRQEVARRNYLISAELAPTASREIAAIMTAYDQWWQDARSYFQEKFLSRSPADGQTSKIAESASLLGRDSVNEQQGFDNNDENGDSGLATVQGALTINKFKRFFVFNSIRQKMFGRTGSAKASYSQRPEIKTTRSLTLKEVHEIRRTAQRLAANRSSKLLKSWIAIIIFLGSVAIGYYRAVYHYQSRQNAQTAHALAVVMLFSFLIFAVYLNGHVGTFHNQKEVLNTLYNLRDPPSSRSEIFPSFELCDGQSMQFQEFVENYEQEYPCAGIINSWRPNKKLLSHDVHDRSTWAMLLVSFLAITTSYSAALIISYMTPTVGFGCRSLAWTCIWLGWISNAVLDIPGLIMTWKMAKPSRKLLKGLWIYSWIRDTVVSSGVILAIVFAQIGFYNSCWCRAGIKVNPETSPVDFGPPTDKQRDDGTLLWLAVAMICLGLMFLYVFYAGSDGENGRLLFVRSLSESMAEQRGIQLEESFIRSITGTFMQAGQNVSKDTPQSEASGVQSKTSSTYQAVPNAHELSNYPPQN